MKVGNKGSDVQYVCCLVDVVVVVDQFPVPARSLLPDPVTVKAFPPSAAGLSTSLLQLAVLTPTFPRRPAQGGRVSWPIWRADTCWAEAVGQGRGLMGEEVTQHSTPCTDPQRTDCT